MRILLEERDLWGVIDGSVKSRKMRTDLLSATKVDWLQKDILKLR